MDFDRVSLCFFDFVARMNLRVRVNSPCGRMDCSPDWGRTRENSLNLRDGELWLVRKGLGWMRTRDREIPLYPGFCAVMRPGGIYDAGHDGENPLGITFVHFDVMGGLPKRAPTAAPYSIWEEFYHIEDLDYFDLTTRRIIQLAEVEPTVSGMLLAAVLEDLRNRPSLEETSPSRYQIHQRRITAMMSKIHSDAGPLPGVADMAKLMGMSPAHFSRVFHQVSGQSAKDFLLGCRMSRARHLLAETDLSVSQVADQLEYADVYFFSRQFKQKTGISPSVYRDGLAASTALPKT